MKGAATLILAVTLVLTGCGGSGDIRKVESATAAHYRAESGDPSGVAHCEKTKSRYLGYTVYNCVMDYGGEPDPVGCVAWVRDHIVPDARPDC